MLSSRQARRLRSTGTAALSAVLAAALFQLPTPAQAAPVGQGFTVTPADLAYILKQIKIAEAHVANTTSATGPCGALLDTGPHQLPSPQLSFGLRTVDGSCNNLIPGQEPTARLTGSSLAWPPRTSSPPRASRPASSAPAARRCRPATRTSPGTTRWSTRSRGSSAT